MIVAANGYPKNGTHLLFEVIAQMGVPQSGVRLRRSRQGTIFGIDRLRERGGVAHSHIKFGSIPDDLKVVTIFRNPRNALVSMVRMKRDNANILPSAGACIAELNNARKLEFSWVQVQHQYLGWLGNRDSPVVHFETLFTAETLNVISDYLGVERINDVDAFKEQITLGQSVLGFTTKTGSWSNWEDVWCDTLDEVWHKVGGPEIEDLINGH